MYDELLANAIFGENRHSFLFSVFENDSFGETEKLEPLKTVLDVFRERLKRRYRSSGSRTARAPLEPYHHFRPHKTDRGHSRGHSQAMVGRRQRSFLRSLHRFKRARRSDVAKRLNSLSSALGVVARFSWLIFKNSTHGHLSNLPTSQVDSNWTTTHSFRERGWSNDGFMSAGRSFQRAAYRARPVCVKNFIFLIFCYCRNFSRN